MRPVDAIPVVLAAVFTFCGCSSSSTASKQEAPSAPPPVFKADFDTSRGSFVVEVHTDWAPLGAAHFYELARAGFYDGDRFFRVVRGFVVQFGINGDPKVNSQWSNMNIPDDPPTQHNQPGTVTFASTMSPNTRSTQLFINLGDNSQSLDSRGFAPFGRVTSGMDVVNDIYAGYGEMAPNGAGPDPTQIEMQGNAYLERQFPHLDYIRKVSIEK